MTAVGRRRPSWAVAVSLAACTSSLGEAPDAGQAPAAGRVSCTPVVPTAPLQRLTQARCRASARAALGLAPLPALDLPPDQSAGPFAANGQAPVGDLAVSQHQAAAEVLAAVAAGARASGLSCGPAPLARPCIAATLAAVGAGLHRRPLGDDEAAAYAGLEARLAGQTLACRGPMLSPQSQAPAGSPPTWTSPPPPWPAI